MRFLFTLLTAVFLGNIAAAATVGDDGLHIQPWIRDTFKDLQEDLDEANAEGKRLAIFFEQRGCIYCTKMHETVYPDPELSDYINENFFVIQLNLHGDLEVVDFDGEELSEKRIARKWGILFTPSVIFLPEEVEDGKTAIQSAVAMMPGAFGRGTTLDMFTWVNEKRYAIDSDEDFQRYHARRINERRAAKE
jgi:thioredoxin-related protein